MRQVAPILAALLLAAPLAGGAAADDAVPAAAAASASQPLLLTDPFDQPKLDPGLWALSQMPQFAMWIDWHVKSDDRDGVLAIRVWPGDSGASCAKPCQRNEIREAPALQLPFGSEVWYAWDMMISGDVARRGSSRWVIGQWKQQNDASPFVAQRYDNGVLHVTVQDNDCRVLVAQSAGDTEAFASLQFQRSLGRNGDYSAFDFLADVPLYQCNSSIRVETFGLGRLPDPHEHWVRMMYHLKGARDGSGFLEVYANDVLVAKASGAIGHDDAAGPLQYFKIGHYRDKMPGTTVLYLDCFARGTSRDAVERATVCPNE